MPTEPAPPDNTISTFKMPPKPDAPHPMSTSEILPSTQQLEKYRSRTEGRDTDEAKMTSRIRQLEDQLRSTEEELDKTKALLKVAISEQPELARTDELSPNRRQMSHYAARPVQHLHSFGTTGRIVDIWEYLMSDIQYLSVYYFPEQIFWESLTPAVQEKLMGWAPKAKQYLESGPRKARPRLIFEAWIWHILDNKIFSRAEGPWPGEHWEAYSVLRRLGAPLASESDVEWTLRYHIWRNLTVGLIRETTQHEARFDCQMVMNSMKEELGPFFHIAGLFSEDDLNERLLRIVKWAVEADFCMHLDRADWSVVFGHPETKALHGFLFTDPKEEPIHPSLWGLISSRSKGFVALSKGAHCGDEELMDGRPVDLITRPMLISYGHGNGYAYHKVHTRFPMQVVVDKFPDDDDDDDGGRKSVSGDDDGDGSGDAKSDGKQEPALELDTEMEGTAEETS